MKLIKTQCTPPSPSGASYQIFRKKGGGGGLAVSQFLEGVAEKEANNVLEVWFSFIKNKVKSQTFMTEKVYKQNYLSLAYPRI